MAKEAGEEYRCSFCFKYQKDVRKLVAGPMVFICEECVQVCLDIIEDDGIVFYGSQYGAETASATPEPPALEHTEFAALVDHVAGLRSFDQWSLVNCLLARFQHERLYDALRCGTETVSSWLEHGATDAIKDRVTALSSSDRWLLATHLLALLRIADVTVVNSNRT